MNYVLWFDALRYCGAGEVWSCEVLLGMALCAAVWKGGLEQSELRYAAVRSYEPRYCPVKLRESVAKRGKPWAPFFWGDKMSIETYKTIDVEIKGMTPLLMNRLNPESLRAKSRMKTQQYSTITDAKNSAYMAIIDGKNQLYIPHEAVYSMMIRTAKGFRVRRITLSGLLAGTMRIEPEKIPLGTDKYEVDERAVVIVGQRVLKGRAKLPEWKVKFQIVINTRRLPQGIESTLQEVLEDAGIRMGLLDFRPQHLGWFGTFTVTKFEYEGKSETPVVNEAQPSELPPTVPAPTKRRGRPPKAQ